LAKFTNASTVPIKTGYLVQNWGFDIGNLQARWYPKAAYAPYVEGGTAPHIINAVNSRVLANAKTRSATSAERAFCGQVDSLRCL
jgi:hypothetical protein